MNMLKRLLILFPLMLFFVIFIFLWRGLHMDPSKIPSPLLNKPAPQFSLNLLNQTNKKFTNDDLQGHVTLLNVWATWCYACALEHSFLIKISNENKNTKENNNNLVLIGLDYKDNNDAALKWLANQGNPYQMVAEDQSGQAAIDWGVYGTPETFVIDKHGIVRYKQIGPINQEAWNTLNPIITKLENES